MRLSCLKLHCNLSLTPDVLIQIFALFLGFLFRSIQLTFTVFGLGVGIMLAVGFSRRTFIEPLLLKAIIPPWPTFNQHPVTWLPSKETKEKQR